MMQCDLETVPSLGLMGIVVHKIKNRAKEMYQEFDMNGSQASILFTLYQRDAMSQKDLAALLNVTPPSITSSIQKMEREGYLTRRPDEADSARDAADACREGQVVYPEYQNRRSADGGADVPGNARGGDADAQEDAAADL